MKHTVEVMIPEQEIQQRVAELGKEITAYYEHSENLVMVGYQLVILLNYLKIIESRSKIP